MTNEIVIIITSSIAAVSSIISAVIANRQRENEKLISELTSKLSVALEDLNSIKKRESKYLDELKEWTGKTKKQLKSEVEQEMN